MVWPGRKTQFKLLALKERFVSTLTRKRFLISMLKLIQNFGVMLNAHSISKKLFS